MSRFTTLAIATVSLFVGPACSGDGAVVDCAEEPMTLELGTGVREFELLTDGDPVVMVHGPQGGWHVDITGALTNTGQEVGLFPTLTLLRGDGIQLAGGEGAPSDNVALSNYDNEVCSGEFVGRQLRFNVEGLNVQQVCSADGETAELEITVEDFEAGRSVTERINVTLQATADDLSQCGQ